MATKEVLLCVLTCIAFSKASFNYMSIREIYPPLSPASVAELDALCSSAPSIENGTVSIELQRSKEKFFLVASYSCKKNSDKLRLVGDKALYCSRGQWRGNKPECKPIRARPKSLNCANDNGGCSHICNRSTGKCECWEGYSLNSDLRTCKDVDECQNSNGGCSQVCNNLPGEYICTCRSGFDIDIKDGKSCFDIDECADPDLSWDCTAGCENTYGSYKCLPSTVGRVDPPDALAATGSETILCKPGFKLSDDGSECQDINECAEFDDDDRPRYCEHKCENLIGSYICHCPEGYHLLDDHQSCASNTKKPSKQTKCPSGFERTADGSQCQDINECISLTNPHNCQQECINAIGSFNCSCIAGYHLMSDMKSCELDAIEKPPETVLQCSHFIQDGNRCSCPRGLKLINNTTCVDPCEIENNGCEHICHTSTGGQCSCRNGFSINANGKSCDDVDECLVNNGGCDQLCLNIPGLYMCKCDSDSELLQDQKTCQKKIPTVSPMILFYCPALRSVPNGVINPPSCTEGPSADNTICRLTCNNGFEPDKLDTVRCSMWYTGWLYDSQLSCIPSKRNSGPSRLPKETRTRYTAFDPVGVPLY
ncbi:multiple epidermal growth factor-like domains protein 6 [Drosophila eugracilis]|uniref:multiple epidermal growth factor-like domains protein 6 n=1 Tax=Drosophila eugracilis TaxID=29029 RepID=UPI0007E698A0|nr:multiple epidermal growth factor-like domains protein 6 [Drosophila eugracilis]